MKSNELVQKLRGRIDALDSQIVRLLNERAAVAMDIGRKKQEQEREAFSPAREAEVLNHVAAENHGPLSGDALRRVYKAIMKECRLLEHEIIHAGKTPNSPAGGES
jgi:chorismate mutase/prephenate dehydratase